MNTFINESVSFLADKHGDKLAQLNILLPSKRSTLFFNIEIAKRFAPRAVWQPRYLSVDDVFESVTGLKIGNKIKLLLLLHKSYSKYINEPFDKFYYWAEMLLSDFDAIDNYQISAKDIFRNIEDIEQIDSLYGDVAAEQRSLIQNFWRRVVKAESSVEKAKFVAVWNVLYPLYCDFNSSLFELGIGYKGLVYRKGVELIKNSDGEMFRDNNYAIVGFNALSGCEKELFRIMAKRGRVDFLWDSDLYYTQQKHDAGLFVRENIRLFSESNLLRRDNYRQPKEIKVVDVPTSAVGCKYVWEFLTSCYENAKLQEREFGSNTAIVLTDESLLLPVLYSIPSFVKNFNITAGYPLDQTTAYTLFEYLTRLFLGVVGRERRDYYLPDVDAVVSHPIVERVLSREQRVIVASFLDRDNSSVSNYGDCSAICGLDCFDVIFNIDRNIKVGEYLDRVLSCIGEIYFGLSDVSKVDNEFLAHLTRVVREMNNVIYSEDYPISDGVYLSALRKHLKSSKVAFVGEPLIGLQIMGILETRNLDFENVLIVSMNDDVYPSMSVASSFIPHSLREGFSLPTYHYRESMYTYYFYRLMQRSRRVDMVYCSVSDGINSGEMSRYISQMKYENHHNIDFKTISMKINALSGDGGIRRCEKFAEYVDRLKSGLASLSPSAIHQWICCQKQFYYKYILKISPPELAQDTIGAMEVGSAMHWVLESIYSSVVGKDSLTAKDCLRANRVSVPDKTSLWLQKHFPDIQNSGALDSVKRFIDGFVTSVIDYDISRQDDFSLIDIERKCQSIITVEVQGVAVDIKLYGVIDRVDSIGAMDMIVDYKTETKKNKIENISSLFDPRSKPNKPVFQVLTYCMMYQQSSGRKCIPSIFFVKDMGRDGANYARGIIVKDRSNIYEVTDYNEVAQEFEEFLKEVIGDIISSNSDYLTESFGDKNCEYCDYKILCRK